MSTTLEERLLEMEAKRRGCSVVQLKMLLAATNSDGTDVVRQIVADNRRSVHQRSSIIPETPRPHVQARPSTVQPLGPPPGIAVIDAMLDAEDRQWREERARQFGIIKPRERSDG
jgi:hypothetical protein